MRLSEMCSTRSTNGVQLPAQGSVVVPTVSITINDPLSGHVEKVGDLLGFKLGFREGTKLGLIEGPENVGFFVGEFEGGCVGARVGVVLGFEVTGEEEGKLEGDWDGLEMVGWVEGSDVMG